MTPLDLPAKYSARVSIHAELWERYFDISKSRINPGTYVNHPLGIKPHDRIPVAEAPFRDGSKLSLALVSDERRYSFETTLTRPNGSTETRIKTKPDNVVGDVDNFYAAFSVPDERSEYVIHLVRGPVHYYVISAESKNQHARHSIALYENKTYTPFDMTAETVGDRLATRLTGKYGYDMMKIAGFLENLKFIVLEENEANDPKKWVNRTVIDDEAYVTACAKAALDAVELTTGYSKLKCGIVNRFLSKNKRGSEPK